MAITNSLLQEKLTAKFGEQVTNFEVTYDMLSFEAVKELNLKVLQFLYDEPTLQFQFMTDLTAVRS